MTDFTSKEMLEIIDRSLRENSVQMAKKYGISHKTEPKADKPAKAARKPALAEASK